MARYFFRCSYEVELGHDLSDTDEVVFRLDRPRPTVIRLSMNCWDGQKPTDAASVICAGEAIEETIDEKISSENVRSLSANLEAGLVTFKGIDPRTKDFLDGIYDELYSSMNRAVALFRWRCGLVESPPDPPRHVREYCSSDGETWLKVLGAPKLRASVISWKAPLPPWDIVCNEVVELINTGTEEPLSWQLFREAWSEIDARPRSALVIGVAAAEVGFKKLVGSLVPHAQWLVDEVQTPSLIRMLTKYLPTLPVKLKFHGKSIRPPSLLLKELQKAVECRNKIVHAGQPPPERNELEQMLRAVSDFLWICDVYGGQGWARHYISGETHVAWPAEEKVG